MTATCVILTALEMFGRLPSSQVAVMLPASAIQSRAKERNC